MRRNRKRNSVSWAPILAILLTTNVAVGLAYSPITSLVKIRVEGALEEDKPRVQALLQRIHDQPALTMDRTGIETKLMERAALSRAELTRNIFGRGTLKLSYRRPAAAVYGMSHAFISREGVIFQVEQRWEGLPILHLPPEANKAIITFCGAWRAGELGALCTELVTITDAERLEIAPSEVGGLCLNIGSKFAVQLGLPDKLDEKVDYLRKQLEDDPSLLESGRTLNLVSIDRPSYKEGVDRIKK